MSMEQSIFLRDFRILIRRRRLWMRWRRQLMKDRTSIQLLSERKTSGKRLQENRDGRLDGRLIRIRRLLWPVVVRKRWCVRWWPSVIRGIRLWYFLHFMKIMEQMRFYPGQIRSTFRWFRRNIILIWAWWKKDFRMEQRQSSCVIRQIRVEKYFPERNWWESGNLQWNMMRLW